jgi:hypothetical protein
MWVNKQVYERMLDELGALRETVADERARHELLTEQNAEAFGKVHEELGLERGRREVLMQQAAVQKAMVEFLCGRVNQLEGERVILLRHLSNIDLPTPSVRAYQPEAPVDPLAAVGIFEDSPRHAPKGWHADGSVNYDGAPTGEQP